LLAGLKPGFCIEPLMFFVSGICLSFLLLLLYTVTCVVCYWCTEIEFLLLLLLYTVICVVGYWFMEIGFLATGFVQSYLCCLLLVYGD
jgi:hypothetical protein